MPGFLDWVSSGISTAVQPFVNWLEDPRDSNLSRPRETSSDPSQKIDQAGGLSILNFPHDRPKYFISFGFTKYHRPSQFQGLKSSGITDYISLPMPNNMRDTNSINYNDSQQGSIIAEALSTLPNLNEDINDIKNSILKTGSVGGLVDNIGSSIASISGVASGWSVKKLVDGVRDLSSGIGEGGLVDSTLQVAGLADNPFMTVALKGPNFKKHHFVWKLAPKSKEESDTIRKIVNTLKKMAYPEILSLGTGGFFKYPAIVWPKYQPDTVLGDVTYKFKPCVLTNVNINYSPEGRTGFYAGTSAPIEIDLEIGLTEIELWRGGDDNNGTGIVPGDFSNVQTPPLAP